MLSEGLLQNWRRETLTSRPCKLQGARTNGADCHLKLSSAFPAGLRSRPGICRQQPSIRLLPFAFLGFKPLLRGLPDDPVHDHAGSPSLLLDLAPHPRFSFLRWRLAVP